MLFEWLERQRARPEAERRALAFALSAGFTGVVALVWISTLFVGGDRVPQQPATEDSPSLSQKAEEFGGNISTFAQQLRKFKAAVGAGFSDRIEYQAPPFADTPPAQPVASATSSATSTPEETSAATSSAEVSDE